MKRDLSKFRRRLGLKLIGAAFILLGFAGMLQLMIRPNIINVCEYNSRAVTVSLIDDAINERLTELGEDVGYSALVKLSYTSDGRVSSIESNTKLINRIKNDMLTEINDRLMKGETENVDLTVGTLSGIPLFHGSGPTVRMKVEPKGYADASQNDQAYNCQRYRIHTYVFCANRCQRRFSYCRNGHCRKCAGELHSCGIRR